MSDDACSQCGRSNPLRGGAWIEWAGYRFCSIYCRGEFARISAVQERTRG